MNRYIEPYASHYTKPEDDWCLVEYDVYSSGVLQGQVKKNRVAFGTRDELVKEYPDAQVRDWSSPCSAYVPDIPPSDFDPADAGEEW